MTKFSVVLEEYLVERDLLNSDHYDGRFLGDRMQGRWRLEDLAKQLDEMIHGANLELE